MVTRFTPDEVKSWDNFVRNGQDLPQEQAIRLLSDYALLEQRCEQMERDLETFRRMHLQMCDIAIDRAVKLEQAEALLKDAPEHHDMDAAMCQINMLSSQLSKAEAQMKELKQYCKELYDCTPVGIADREQEHLNAEHADPAQGTVEEGKG